MNKSYNSTYALIDLNNLFHNYSLIESVTNSKILAVVKANAYGHGIEEIAKFLSDFNVQYFAVANLYEAIRIRNAGILTPILVLGYTEPSFADVICNYGLTQCVFSYEYATMLAKNLRKDDMVKVHIKVDTGMGRLGLSCKTFDEVFDCYGEIFNIKTLKNLCVEGVFSHVYDADDEVSAMRQLALFRALRQVLGDGYIYHLFNTDCCFRYQNEYDFVRSGIGLCGYGNDCLNPTLSLYSTVAQIKVHGKGENIGYSNKFCTTGNCRVATVPVGYADGLPRTINKGHFIVNGKVAPVLGATCMDQTMVDVSDIDCKAGDVVTVIGNGISAEYWAKLCDTIPYEVLADLSDRVCRVYIR